MFCQISTMFFLPILSLFCAVLSSADSFCYEDAEIILTPLASCTRAIGELQTWVEECGAARRDFGPAPVSPGVIPLAQHFIDPHRSAYVKCAIALLWAPRPNVSPPAPSALDNFYPPAIVNLAFEIMFWCSVSFPYSPGQRYPLKLGYGWIQPHQWVFVDFIQVRGNEGNSSDLGSRNGNVTVATEFGANSIVDASMFNPSTCGNPITLPNVSGNATEAVVAA